MDLWDACRIMLVSNERNPREWLQKKKLKKIFLMLSTYKLICIYSVKILCINKYMCAFLEMIRDKIFLLSDPDSAP
jgi:hypothetical protein